jgi:hypothetical protein
MFTCDISRKKVFKMKSSGVDEQSVHLEIKCSIGRNEPWGVALGGHSVGFKMLLGRSELGRFIKAPENNTKLPIRKILLVKNCGLSV